MGLLSALKPAPLEELREEILIESIKDKIDPEAGIIRDVKICGRVSKNGYEYTDPALREAAKLYEGIEVNINHPAPGSVGKTRDLMEGWGMLKNVRVVAGDGAYGDLHYLKSHPQTAMLLERVERGMSIGLSHNAQGKVVARNGRRFVESVPHAKSVDIVSRPATVNNLFESEQGVTLAELIETNKESKSPLVAILEGFATAAPQVGQMPMQPPSGMQPGMMGQPGDQQLLAGLMSTLKAIVDSGKLTAQDVVRIISKAIGSAPGEETGDDPDKKPPGDNQPSDSEDEGMFDDPEKKKKFEESVQAAVTAGLKPLTEQVTAQATELATIKKEAAARKLLESVHTTPATVGAERFKSLLEAENDEAAKKLVESWPPAVRGAQRPAAQTGGTTTTKKIPRLIHARR